MDQFTKNIILAGGNDGENWLNSLPSLVSFFTEKWQLAALSPVKNLSYNFILKGYRKKDNFKIVLKLGFFKDAIKQEASALNAYNGNGCAKLLAFDESSGALLLEQVSPGVSLKTLFPAHDEAAVVHAVRVMQQLHTQPVIDRTLFPTIEHWLNSLNCIEKNILPKNHLERAQELSSDLLGSQGPSVLLHGDLHHDNILLSNTRSSWLVIDPKGVIGEPAYEVGAFIRNPMSDLLELPDPSKIIAKRLTLFADLLKIDKQRLKDWSYVQAILAACWAAEDGGAWQQWIRCAELIDKAT